MHCSFYKKTRVWKLYFIQTEKDWAVCHNQLLFSPLSFFQYFKTDIYKFHYLDDVFDIYKFHYLDDVHVKNIYPFSIDDKSISIRREFVDETE
jgi:hypothetical protein